MATLAASNVCLYACINSFTLLNQNARGQEEECLFDCNPEDDKIKYKL